MTRETNRSQARAGSLARACTSLSVYARAADSTALGVVSIERARSPPRAHPPSVRHRSRTRRRDLAASQSQHHRPPPRRTTATQARAMTASRHRNKRALAPLSPASRESRRDDRSSGPARRAGAVGSPPRRPAAARRRPQVTLGGCRARNGSVRPRARALRTAPPARAAHARTHSHNHPCHLRLPRPHRCPRTAAIHTWSPAHLPFRGGVSGRDAPPNENFCFSAGFRMRKEHMSDSSTAITAPALSNSPQ